MYIGINTYLFIHTKKEKRKKVEPLIIFLDIFI